MMLGMQDTLWPELPYDTWKDTYATLHMWSQVIGKIALTQAPPLNHSWGSALQLTPRGLSTRTLPHGARSFVMQLDFLDHQLVIDSSDGSRRELPLAPMTVADFYRRVLDLLQEMQLPVKIWSTPVEIPAPIRFEKDTVHQSYDPVYATRVWQILRNVERVMSEARVRFVGKCSPVHFFWGSFDLAVTRFSGRLAPPREGPAFMTEAYSHELISHGFWPGNDMVPQAVFYAYAVPEPAGLKEVRIEPAGASYDHALGEFVLPYDVVRTAPDPAHAITRFIETTYEQAATLAGWDRQVLERHAPAGSAA
jgi:hypothetical protein